MEPEWSSESAHRGGARMQALRESKRVGRGTIPLLTTTGFIVDRHLGHLFRGRARRLRYSWHGGFRTTDSGSDAGLPYQSDLTSATSEDAILQGGIHFGRFSHESMPI